MPELASRLYEWAWEHPIGLVLALQLIQLVVTVWITASMKHRYAKKLEEYRWDIRVRGEAIKVAKLLSEARGGPTEELRKLNRMTWELSFWLPADVVRQLNTVLGKSPTRPEDLNKVLIAVRKHLLSKPRKKPPRDNLTDKEITTFYPLPEKPEDET